MNDHRYFVLDAEGQPQPCDLKTWARWFEKTEDRRIAQDMDEGQGEDRILVSTVFLGLNHRFSGNGPPILWETLVFGGPLDGKMRRYDSLADALQGHQEMCRQVSALSEAGDSS